MVPIVLFLSVIIAIHLPSALSAPQSRLHDPLARLSPAISLL